jgi:hypothetical protein
MAVFDALRHLAVYLRENHPVNHLADLYELVQYAGTDSRETQSSLSAYEMQETLCHVCIS